MDTEAQGDTDVQPARNRTIVRVRRGLARGGIVLGIVVGVSAALALVFALWLNHSLSNITKVELNILEANRPPETDNGSLTFLLLGADSGTARNGEGTSILKDASSGTWPPGRHRSDATLLVQITADRSKAYVISLPRDSFVPIYDAQGVERQRGKINAALSLYGPSGAVSTLEHLSGLRIDHFAMVDWDGFGSITDALGGVTIGTATLDGSAALEYVRERYLLANGDLDRVKRQQNYLRALSSKMLEAGTLTNPLKLKRTLDAVTSSLAVDSDWTSGNMRSLGFSLRGIRRDDVVFLTIPTNGTADDPKAGSIVLLDERAGAAMFDAMRRDDMSTWVSRNDRLVLGERVD